MFLKSLQMNGFKSFPDKIQLNFEKGITACVGPNGSGKSNVSDAVRWVMGEQTARVLRIKAMEDIIFNGTENRKAMGMAEVILVIDNSDRRLSVDSDEVAICRRYYRSGASEYKINGQMVRLKDINRLLMDTGMGRDGYSIIGQGKVAEIVDARAGDRRAIFEEAAGIAKYRDSKNEAERNLQKAEDNLVHLNILMADLEQRVGPLEKEAEKAKKYNVLWEQKRSSEIGLWLSQLSSLQQLLRDQDYRITLLVSQQDDATAKIEQLENDILSLDEQRNSLLAKKDEIMRAGASLEEQATQLEGEAQVIDNDLMHTRADIERIEREIEEAQQGGRAIHEQIEEKKRLIEEKKKAIDLCIGRAAEAERAINELAGDESGHSGELDSLRSRQSAVVIELANNRVSIASLETRMAETAQQADGFAQEKLRCEDELARSRQEKELTADAIESVSEKINELTNSSGGYRMRLDKNKRKCAEIKTQYDKLCADADDASRHARMLEDLEKNLDGFGHSVKAVMKRTREGMMQGVHGPVSSIIDTPADYAVAVEIALGGAIQNIVVDNEDCAKRAMAYLKQSNSGRATFLPITTIKSRHIQDKGLEDCDGYVGIASELVDFDEKYRSIVENLLGSVLVVEDIDCAVRIARKYSYRFKIVTLDGQVVNAGGSMTGGSQSRSAGILSRRSELEKLREKAKQCTQKAEQTALELKEANRRVSADEAALLAVQSELQTAREDNVRFEADLRILEQRIIISTQQLERLESDSEKQQEAMQRFESELESLKLAVSEGEKLEAELTARIAEVSGEMDRLADRRAELTDMRSQAGLEQLALDKECEALSDAIAELAERIRSDSGRQETMRAQIEELTERIAQLVAKAQSLRDSAAERRTEASAQRSGIDDIEQQRDELERQVQTKRRESRDEAARREGMTGEIERLREKTAHSQRDYDNIIIKLQEEYSLTRREAEEQFEPAEDEKAALRRTNELRAAIRALGSVNLGAIDEFAEVSERYTVYKTQIGDIEKSKAELIKLIESLTEDMKKLFSENFAQINKHFGRIFPEIFGGGSAKLELTDPDDCLNSGIEIEITQPGKAPQSNTESFSGGEKAIIAVAIYFAIMKVNPSPFCVLDEIDSALDENNVANIARYIERMSDTTQYIVITHRRGTMEVARTLYGVTKREGVSRMLELNIGEIEEKLGKLE